MADITATLDRWKASLCPQVSLAGLFARNPVAHKWKATLRSLTLRECVFWRVHDLLTQAHLLHQAKHTLGSRILIRSALESVATLIHLNQLTSQVLDGSLNFHVFDLKTRTLLLGSRDGSTKHTSINIVTVLSHCEKKYKGVSSIYATLSECAHPNYEGICIGYSEVDHDRYETNLANRWPELWADRHERLVELVAAVFEAEYNEVWPDLFNCLEKWIEENDAVLEATKNEV
ncbi:hypothetical protein PE066_02420 [Ramlibacter tataouinensis]|uniref:hypothetical protein n=1 Tax=Ramlibacter tataouinensis TaxID=94132 RepID=UPI0022F3AA35|nr:hypothetical protein [Ramlibacter tataouinensis]WBY02409.1 hypothetical protein PE066_02420 [Ramlibacter tataouinensis]